MDNLSLSIRRIRSLVITQRTTRLLVRAVWTGIAGYLIAESLGSLTDFQVHTNTSILIGIIFALPSLFAAIRPLPVNRLVWRMDRLLGLREQTTTAWRLTAKKETLNLIEDRLVEDVERFLPGTRARISKHGWYLRQDLQALVIVSLMLSTGVLFQQIGTAIPFTDAEPTTLPALDQPPSFESIFPSGIPGLTEAAPISSGSNPGDPAGGPSNEEVGEINNILTDLGEALSEHPETADIGGALENGDLEGAAAAIERTADSVDLLPEDARQNMQRALEQAAAQAQEAGQQDLADDLSRAAQSLQNVDPNNPLTADALDQLADELRALGETFGAMGSPGQEDGFTTPGSEPQVGSAGGESGSGSGSGVHGLAEPLTRIEGEGQEFTIEGGDIPSGLLQPGNAPGTNVTIDGGTVGITGSGETGSTGTINSILFPYSYSWRWRDVVSEYFSP